MRAMVDMVPAPTMEIFMKYAATITLPAPRTFGRPVKRKSAWKRLLVALHVSRRRQARKHIRSYRQLLGDDS
jgi:hypothetical protein